MRRLLVLLLIQVFLSINPLHGQVSEEKLDSSLQIVKRDIIRIESLISSQKSELDNARNIIELQNKQLEQANDMISLYFGLIAISLAIFGIVVYFQFIRPIQQQKEEIKSLNAQSKKILDDINGTLKEVVEENYAKYQDERLKKVLYSLHDDQASNIGIQVLKEFGTIGFTASQLSIIRTYLLNIQNIEFGQKNNSMINLGVRLMIDSLINSGKLDWIEEIFELYFSPGIKGSVLVYFPMYDKYAEFLAKNMKVEDHNKVIKIVTNVHPFYDDVLEQRTRLFNSWLYKIVHFQPMIAAQILDNRYFVNEINRLGILEQIISIHRSNEQKQDAFGTRTQEIGDTYFLGILHEINERLEDKASNPDIAN